MGVLKAPRATITHSHRWGQHDVRSQQLLSPMLVLQHMGKKIQTNGLPSRTPSFIPVNEQRIFALLLGAQGLGDIICLSRKPTKCKPVPCFLDVRVLPEKMSIFEVTFCLCRKSSTSLPVAEEQLGTQQPEFSEVFRDLNSDQARIPDFNAKDEAKLEKKKKS